MEEPKYVQTWREDALCYLDITEKSLKAVRMEIERKADYQAQIAGHTALEHICKMLNTLAGAVERKKQ